MTEQTKKVEIVLAPPAPHMVGDGFRVHNFFPSGYTFGHYRMSPFFLMDYNSKVDFTPKLEPRGVGVHPHRGFETVTIAYHGKVAHHDSAGNSGVIANGDVQWMTAGSGILHKEYHDKEYSQKGGPFQMVQLWVNLPAKNKMTTPKYQGIARNQMSHYTLPNDGGVVEVIAGDYKGIKGPASTFTPINLYNMRLKKGTVETFKLPANFNTGLLVLEGNITINAHDVVPTDHFALFKNEGEEITLSVNEDAVVLILNGEPISEDLFAHGPFLMNTRDEILKAFDDLAKGKFGILED